MESSSKHHNSALGPRSADSGLELLPLTSSTASPYSRINSNESLQDDSQTQVTSAQRGRRVSPVSQHVLPNKPQDDDRNEVSALLIEEHSLSQSSTSTSASESSATPEIPSERPVSYKQSDFHESALVDCTWLPFTLRLPYLITLCLSTTSLACILIWLTVYSSAHNGLGSDRTDSVVLFFGWRFVPTLVTVVFTVLIGAMWTDVRRTEAFARLSYPAGSSSASSVCFKTGFFLKDPYVALRKSKNNNKRSWSLFFAASAYILATILINPLSAALLAPSDQLLRRDISFNMLDISGPIELETASLDARIYKTISASILNVSTSAWITDDAFVLPFWPSTLSEIPLSARFRYEGTTQTWRAQSTVFRSRLACDDLTTQDLPIEDSGLHPKTVIFTSKDNCVLNVTVGFGRRVFFTDGGGWAARNVSDRAVQYLFRELGEAADRSVDFAKGRYMNISSTGPCADRSFLYYGKGHFVRGLNATNSGFGMAAHVCAINYEEAVIDVSVEISEFGTEVSFDESEYQRHKRILDLEKYQTSRLDESFFSPDWTTKLPYDAGMYGPLAMIAHSTFNGSMSAMLRDTSLVVQKLRQLHQQWVGQVLLHSLSSGRGVSSGPKLGQRYTKERRIIVVTGIGITLAVLLILISIMIGLVIILTRLSKRPLNLQHDPAKPAVLASLIATSNGVRHVFNDFDRLTSKVMARRLQQIRFNISSATLIPEMPRFCMATLATTVQTGAFRKKAKSQRWKPTVMRGYMGCVLVLFLLALLGALPALYGVSVRSGLRARALVYEKDVKLNRITTTLAPYSIIPTLLATAVSLWFGEIENVLKRLVPFITMTTSDEVATRSLLAHYANTPLFLATVEGLRNRHYIIAVIGVASLGAQIFLVSMSALWDLKAQPISHTIPLQRILELRSVPRSFEAPAQAGFSWQDPAPRQIIDSVYHRYIANWMYGAMTEMTSNGPTPRWTKDSWSFVPADLTGLTDTAVTSLFPDTRSSNQSQKHDTRITLRTQALRGRFICNATDYNAKPWKFLDKLIYDDSTRRDEIVEWSDSDEVLLANLTRLHSSSNATALKIGWALKSVMDGGGEMIFRSSVGNRVNCCTNITKGVVGKTAVGYWTSPNGTFGGRRANSVMVKWVVGTFSGELYTTVKLANASVPTDQAGFIWTEQQPRLQVVACDAIIEQANASVTVDLATQIVRNYRILGHPTTAKDAWSDAYVNRGISADYTGETRDDDFWPGYNFTTSYGYALLDAMTSAVAIKYIGGTPYFAFYLALKDRAFTFRDPGLNLDYMSYAMLGLVNGNTTALLDSKTLANTADRTFQTFFKHFVSTDNSATDGGWAFQPVGAILNPNLGGPRRNASVSPNRARSIDVDAQVTIFAETLVMSPVAVYLSVGLLLLIFLVVLTVFVFYGESLYNLPRDVDTLASVLSMLYGSEKLLEWAARKKEMNNWKDDANDRNTMVRLGWFPDARDPGRQRWGIELVDESEDEDETATNALPNAGPA